MGGARDGTRYGFSVIRFNAPCAPSRASRGGAEALPMMTSALGMHFCRGRLT